MPVFHVYSVLVLIWASCVAHAVASADLYQFQIRELCAVTEAPEWLLDARGAYAVGDVYQAG